MIYIAAEGESVTLQEKIKAIGGSKVKFAEIKDRYCIKEYLRAKSCDFVFIDSINNAGIDNDFLEIIKQDNPEKSFISIVQATKGGNFKGDQALTHNCDFIIKVVQGVASHSGRFNTSTEINIFSEPLYKKNIHPRKKSISVHGENIDTYKEETLIEKVEESSSELDPVELPKISDQDIIDDFFKSIVNPSKVNNPIPIQKKKQITQVKAKSKDDKWFCGLWV